MKAALIALVALAGCGWGPNHSADPQTCRERAAYRMASSYPSPTDLGIAVAVVCDGLVPSTPTQPPAVTTTTRDP